MVVGFCSEQVGDAGDLRGFWARNVNRRGESKEAKSKIMAKCYKWVILRNSKGMSGLSMIFDSVRRWRLC